MPTVEAEVEVEEKVKCWNCDRALPITVLPKVERIVVLCPRCHKKNALPRPDAS